MERLDNTQLCCISGGFSTGVVVGAVISTLTGYFLGRFYGLRIVRRQLAEDEVIQRLRLQQNIARERIIESRRRELLASAG